jgi:hypothetical protein
MVCYFPYVLKLHCLRNRNGTQEELLIRGPSAIKDKNPKAGAIEDAPKENDGDADDDDDTANHDDIWDLDGPAESTNADPDLDKKWTKSDLYKAYKGKSGPMMYAEFSQDITLRDEAIQLSYIPAPLESYVNESLKMMQEQKFLEFAVDR